MRTLCEGCADIVSYIQELKLYFPHNPLEHILRSPYTESYFF